ncbi:MAG: VCBS domain-containing protein [Hyphomicrobium sp.]
MALKKLVRINFSDLCGNAVPVIRPPVQAPLIFTEYSDGSAGENIFVHSGTGTLHFTDANSSDTHSASFVPLGTGYRGSFSLGRIDQHNDTVKWTFTATDKQLDSLQAGQKSTQHYKVAVADGHGGRAFETISVTLIGKNDAPFITSPYQTARITELYDGAKNENAHTHTGSGTIRFADVDTLDTHTASFVPLGSGYLGDLSLNPVNQASNTLGWTFRVPDSALDSLQAGQTRVQQYKVAISDGHGGIAIEAITVSLIGTNDAPIITTPDQAAQITEVVDGAAHENTHTHTAAGTIRFADVDTLDTHTASFVPLGSGYLGSLSLELVNQTSNTLGWIFQVPDSALDSLQAGQTRVQQYKVAISDGHGGTAYDTIVVTLTGTNDAPVITSPEQEFHVTSKCDDDDDDDHSDEVNYPDENDPDDSCVDPIDDDEECAVVTSTGSGTITFSDVDLLDTHTASFQPEQAGYIGQFVLGPVNNSSNDVGWTFTFDHSSQGGAVETTIQHYTVTIDDGHGGTATQTVTVSIDACADQCAYEDEISYDCAPSDYGDPEDDQSYGPVLACLCPSSTDGSADEVSDFAPEGGICASRAGALATAATDIIVF